MVRKSGILVLAVTCLVAVGCTSLQDSSVEMETGLRDHILAQKAWNEWSWCYEELDHPWHFAKGFKDGYQNILEGGNGCQPTLPPRCYWKPCYQTPEGRCKTNAWFDGFSHGALAAQQDGYGNLQQIPISPTARANLLSSKAPVSGSIYGDLTSGSHQMPDTVPDVPVDDQVFENEGAIVIPPATEAGPLQPPVRPYDDP